jgi:hypothetical protein
MATTIYTYLHNDDLNGSRIVSMDDCMCKLYDIKIQEDIETAKQWSELSENHAHYFLNDKDILTSGDGFSFAVCVEWERNNIINVLGIAKALGWTFEIVR